jgi:RNase P/RNase MRP subunit p29
MDLVSYVGLKVKILLRNNYYYVGVVINADKDSLDLKDIKGQNVSLSKDTILTIQEVSNGY